MRDWNFFKNSETVKVINEMKNAIEIIGNRADQMEERLSDLEDRNIELMEEESELRFFFYLK